MCSGVPPCCGGCSPCGLGSFLRFFAFSRFVFRCSRLRLRAMRRWAAISLAKTSYTRRHNTAPEFAQDAPTARDWHRISRSHSRNKQESVRIADR